MIHRFLTAVFALVLSGVTASADGPAATPAPAPSSPAPDSSSTASPAPAAADSLLPGDGFAATHYETLWTKSPFAVATAEAPATSPDYSLVGLGRTDGVAFVNVLDKQSNELFLISADKPVRGLTLVSISRGATPNDSSAVIKRGGESITLKIEQGGQVSSAMAIPPMGNGNAAPVFAQQPGAMQQPGAPGMTMPGGQPPGVRYRPRLTIHLPPAPGAQPAPAPAPAPGGATTAAPATPPPPTP